jgi:hypothetical protein
LIQRAIQLAVALTAIGVTALAAQQDDSAALSIRFSNKCGACLDNVGIGLHPLPVAITADTGRPRAIEYSDAYAVRLKIHLIGSYAELPLFVGEYIVGEKVLSDERGMTGRRRSSLTGLHSAVAGGLGALFAVNTVTGVWNLADSWHDPAGRTRRWLHSILMLVADGGFVLTAQAAGAAKRTDAGAAKHRNLAIGSMSIAAASTIMMWLWKD